MSKLILITTPIGNLGDITRRAQEALSGNGTFLAEDTRSFHKLLGLLGITEGQRRVESFHEHSREKIEHIMARLEAGEDVYITSDAGSPVLSDPAYPLIQAAIERGYEIDTLPGASAVTSALELSGLPPIPFHFHGFVPRAGGERKSLMELISSQGGTHLFFESPNRVIETAELFAAKFPEARFAVIREISKTFQSVYRFVGSDFPMIKNEIVDKGEFVLALHLAGAQIRVAPEQIEGPARECLQDGARPKSVAKLIAAALGMNTKEVYELLVERGTRE
jgi:16S rRNA (cytidine1402-2'-O)-methyltransferase